MSRKPYTLDGSDDIKPEPFDAHEQVVRGHHTHSPERGYEKAEGEYKPEDHEGDEISDKPRKAKKAVE